jgi:hypothetical protein
MSASPHQNSNTPATQANRLPIAGVSQAPHKSSFPSVASLSATVRSSIERVENSPSFSTLTADSPLRALLASLFAVTRQLTTAVASDPHVISAKLGKIESLISDLNNKIQPRSQATYAQAARAGIACVSPAFAPLCAAPVETTNVSKQLLIKIAPNDSAILKDLSPEQIVKRLQEDGETPAAQSIIAAKKLPSGDVILHLNNVLDKAKLQANTEWTSKLGPSAKIHTNTFPVLIHSVSTAGSLREDPSPLAHTIVTENLKRHPGLKILKTAWLNKITEDKRFSSLIVHVASAAQANRLITEGVLLRYELKTAERFDRRSRIIQCYKCQQYSGHTSHTCNGPERCGNCGQEHKTAACTIDTQAIPRRCAACNGANHPSWSPHCPARIKDAERAKHAKELCPWLYPMSAQPAKDTQVIQTHPSSLVRQTQANSQPIIFNSQEEWSSQESGIRKKRTLKPSGRPPKSATIDIDFGAMDVFVSQTTNKRAASESPRPQSPSKRIASEIPLPQSPMDPFFDCSLPEANDSQSN